MWLSSLPFIGWFWYWKNQGISKDCGSQIFVIHCRYLTAKSILDIFLFFFFFNIFFDFQLERLESIPDDKVIFSFYTQIFGQELFYIEVTREKIDAIKEVRE